MTSEPKSRTRLDPAVRRRQIAEAAARVFAERDPSEVSFEAVAEAAGVSRSLVYSYYGDRGSLLAAAYSCELRRLDRQIDAALEKIGDDRTRLLEAVRAYLRFAAEHGDRWNLIVAGGSSRHPAVRDANAARIDRIAGTLGGSDEAQLLVHGVVGMIEAAAEHVLEGEAADPDELAELLTQVIWAGISSLSGDG